MKKTEWLFEIPGPLLGYRASVRRAFDPDYARYKERVRLHANIAGVPATLPATPGYAVLSISIFWKNDARIDTSNVLKAIEDGLWEKDRRVLGLHVDVAERRKVEKAVVGVAFRDGE